MSKNVDQPITKKRGEFFTDDSIFFQNTTINFGKTGFLIGPTKNRMVSFLVILKHKWMFYWKKKKWEEKGLFSNPKIESAKIETRIINNTKSLFRQEKHKQDD